jgi:hypothetical protein
MARRMCSCGQRPAKFLPRARRYLCDPCGKAEGLLVPCSGEAHSNPYIDNCGICAPRWGLVEARNWNDWPGADAQGRTA